MTRAAPNSSKAANERTSVFFSLANMRKLVEAVGVLTRLTFSRKAFCTGRAGREVGPLVVVEVGGSWKGPWLWGRPAHQRALRNTTLYPWLLCLEVGGSWTVAGQALSCYVSGSWRKPGGHHVVEGFIFRRAADLYDSGLGWFGNGSASI